MTDEVHPYTAAIRNLGKRIGAQADELAAAVDDEDRARIHCNQALDLIVAHLHGVTDRAELEKGRLGDMVSSIETIVADAIERVDILKEPYS